MFGEMRPITIIFPVSCDPFFLFVDFFFFRIFNPRFLIRVPFEGAWVSIFKSIARILPLLRQWSAVDAIFPGKMADRECRG